MCRTYDHLSAQSFLFKGVFSLKMDPAVPNGLPPPSPGPLGCAFSRLIKGSDINNDYGIRVTV
jgi:hypothetical protein